MRGPDGERVLWEHAVSKVQVGSAALPGYWISRVPGADTAAVGRGRGVCPRTRVPYTGGNCLQAIEKPLHLHGRSPGPRGVVGSSRAVGASILGGLWEPRVLWGAATSGRGDTVTTPGPGSSAVMERFSICVRKDQPHHRRWHRGDTSHSRPAPCDVALEVSRGQTGSLGWYPVLNTRFLLSAETQRLQGVVPAPREPSVPLQRTPQPFHPPKACRCHLLRLPRFPHPLPSASPASSASLLLVLRLSRWT